MTAPDERDRWLEQALRHAPDADAAPPDELRAAILSSAREGSGSLSRKRERIGARAVRSQRKRWWRADAAPSPQPSPASGRGSSYAGTPVVAAFATLALSTVLGALWWGGSLDEGADPRVAESTTAPAPAPAPAAAPAPDPATETAPPQIGDASPPAAVQKARRALARPSPPDTPARAAEAERAEPPPTATATADAPRSPAHDDELRASRPATAQALAGAATEQRIDTRGAPIDAVASSLALRADALHWASGGRTHAHAAPQQAWFDALRQATAGRWQRTRTADRDGARVQLFDGPRVRAEWLVQPQRVLWLDAESGTWQAPLTPDDSARLRAMADAW